MSKKEKGKEYNKRVVEGNRKKKVIDNKSVEDKKKVKTIKYVIHNDAKIQGKNDVIDSVKEIKEVSNKKVKSNEIETISDTDDKIDKIEENGGKLINPSWKEIIYGRDHKLTPKIRRFILLFVNKGEGKTVADFAKYFKVSIGTISNWMAYPQVKKEIQRLLESQEEQVLSLLKSKHSHLVDSMMKLIDSPKTNAETKRKIAYDLFSFGQVKNVNKGGSVILQRTEVNTGEKLSEEEIDAQLRELDELDEIDT